MSVLYRHCYRPDQRECSMKPPLLWTWTPSVTTPGPKNIRRINVDAYFVLSLGVKVYDDKCRVGIVYRTWGDTDRNVEFACFDLPPLENWCVNKGPPNVLALTAGVMSSTGRSTKHLSGLSSGITAQVVSSKGKVKYPTFCGHVWVHLTPPLTGFAENLGKKEVFFLYTDKNISYGRILNIGFEQEQKKGWNNFWKFCFPSKSFYVFHN